MTALSLSSTPPLAAAAGSAAGALDLANLLLVLLAAWATGRLAVRVGYPAVLGELLAGIILGPPLLGLLAGGEALSVLGNVGIILMMLYIGMEIDLDDLRSASVPGLLAAAGGFIVPAVLGYAVIVAFGGSALAGVFVGISVGVTSLATKSRILVDLDLLDTRIAYVLMAGALLSDTATLVIFAGIVGFVEAGGLNVGATSQVVAEVVGFFAVAVLLGHYLVPRLVEAVKRWGSRDRMLTFALVITIGLGYAEMAELAGLHAILGSFVGGLFLRREVLGERRHRAVEELLSDVSVGFLAPIFFVMAGFEISFAVFRTDLALLVAVVAVAMLGKIVGTALFYVPSGHGWREGVTVGVGMNGRGAVEIVVAGIGMELGLISQEIFTILVFMAIATTATVPVLLTAAVRWLRRRGELVGAREHRRDVVIVGAGPSACLLAEQLAEQRTVRLIDSQETRCRAARRRGLEVVHGDAMNPDVMRDAHIGSAKTLLAVTSNAEVNVLAAQLAREDFHVPVAGASLSTSTDNAITDLLDRAGVLAAPVGPAGIAPWDSWVVTGRVELTRIEVDHDEEGQWLLTRWMESNQELPLVLHRDGDVLTLVEAGEPVAGDEIVVARRTPYAAPTVPWARPAEAAADAPVAGDG